MATDDGGHVVNRLRCLPHPANKVNYCDWTTYFMMTDVHLYGDERHYYSHQVL